MILENGKIIIIGIGEIGKYYIDAQGNKRDTVNNTILN